jgi:polyhydroxyalkanoate synthesis regulator phasin
MNKKYLLYVMVPVLALVSVGAVYADSVANNSRPIDSLVTAIATKFNLNTSDVQQVFDENRATAQAQRQTEMQQKFADRLSQAVTDGKLTQAQVNLITAKRAELQAQRQNLQNGTPEINRETAKAHIDELKQWATDNNIPMEYLQLGGFEGMRMGHGFGKVVK